MSLAPEAPGLTLTVLGCGLCSSYLTAAFLTPTRNNGYSNPFRYNVLTR